MAVYTLTPPTTLPSLAAKEAKEQRKKVLQEAWKRRRVIYKNYLKKLRSVSLPTD